MYYRCSVFESDKPACNAAKDLGGKEEEEEEEEEEGKEEVVIANEEVSNECEFNTAHRGTMWALSQNFVGTSKNSV